MIEFKKIPKLKNKVKCYKCGKKFENKMIFVFVNEKYLSEHGENPCINCYREMLIQDIFKN